MTAPCTCRGCTLAYNTALDDACKAVEALWGPRDELGYLLKYDVRKDVADAMLPWITAAIKGVGE